MKLLILFIIWFIIGLVGSQTLENHQYGLFVICAIAFPILSVVLLFKTLSFIFQTLARLITPKKKYREVKILEKDDVYEDSSVEHITLDHPDYIGLLTKINKKKIAKDYITKQKGKHERK